jgi:hypothetical protein
VGASCLRQLGHQEEAASWEARAARLTEPVHAASGRGAMAPPR